MTEPNQLDIETEILKMEEEYSPGRAELFEAETLRMEAEGYARTDNDPED